MICSNCGEKFDEDKFPFCPFCLFEYKKQKFENEIENIKEGSHPEVETNQSLSVSNDNKTQKVDDEIDEKDSKKNDKVLVKNVFVDGLAVSFVDYCEKNGIKYMDDLEGFDFFESLFGTPGFGAARIKKIRKTYLEYIERLNDVKNRIHINKELYTIDISILECLGIKKISIERMNELGIYNFSDLAKHHSFELERFFTGRSKNNFKMFLQKSTECGYDDFMSFCIKYNVDEDLFDIVLQRIKYVTLEKLAEKYNLTRERIRQKEKVFYENKKSLFNYVVQCLGNEVIYLDDILKYFTDDNLNLILLHYFEISKDFELFNEADCFLRVYEGISRIDELNNEICAFADEECSLMELYNFLEEYLEEKNLDFLTNNQINKILENNKYIIFNQKVYKNMNTLSKYCALLVEKYYPNGIHIYDETELDSLKLLLKKHFNYETKSGYRALTARVSEKLVLCDKGVYTTPDKIMISNELLNEIHDYISDSEETTLFYSEIFDQFSGKLKLLSNVTNYNFLHGVLKYYFDDEFQGDRDAILKTGRQDKVSFDEKIKNYLTLKNVPVKKQEVLNNLKGLNMPYLNNAVAAKNGIFSWEPNYITCREVKPLTSEEITYLIDTIDKIQKNLDGYCCSRLLLEQLSLQFKDKYEITKHENIYFLCEEYLDDRFIFRNPYILDKNIYDDKTTTYDIILSKTESNGFIDYRDIMRIGKYLKIAPITLSVVYQEIEEKYVRLNLNQYCIPEKIPSLFDKQNLIEESIIQNYLHNSYFSITEISDFEVLPDIEFEWTTQLLRYFVENISTKLKVVEPITKDRRYERGIAIKSELDINDFEEFIIYFLKIKNINKIEESDLLSILLIENIIYNVLPIDLKEPKKLKLNNGYYVVN